MPINNKPLVRRQSIGIHGYITLHYKLFRPIVAKVKKKLQGPLWRKSHNNMTAEISVSSVFDEMTTAMLQ